MKDKIKDMPKVELHLHLDGSVSTKLLCELSGLSLEEVLDKSVSRHDHNLRDYLKCLDFVGDLLNTKEGLEEASFNLVSELEKENVIYAEIRFAPISHIDKGLSLEEVVEAVLKGLRRGKIKTNLILCLKRGWNIYDNFRIIHLANKYLGKGVVAVDLVGDEEHFPFEDYEYLFKVCQKAGIPFTIHAGEIKIDDLYKVIYYTKRIGHGIKCLDDLDLVEKIKKNNILLEVCPSSNLDMGNILNYRSHPIKKLYDMGVNVSINTDNMTVSEIDLNKEYQNLYETFAFSIDDFKKMNMMAIDHAFLSKEEKEDLIKKIENYR